MVNILKNIVFTIIAIPILLFVAIQTIIEFIIDNYKIKTK